MNAKIVLYGSESTGKTTLSKALAQHFDTLYLPEFARTYFSWQQKIRDTENISIYEDITNLALAQIGLEELLLQQPKKCYFLDTDLLQIIVYSHLYFQKCPDWLTKLYEQSNYEFYLLMDIDIEWVADELRDRPQNRQDLLDMFEYFLKKYKKKYQKISGQGQERTQNAIEIVQNFLQKN